MNAWITVSKQVRRESWDKHLPTRAVRLLSWDDVVKLLASAMIGPAISPTPGTGSWTRGQAEGSHQASRCCASRARPSAGALRVDSPLRIAPVLRVGLPTPAGTTEITRALTIALESVCTHMRALFEMFEIADVPHNPSAPSSRASRSPPAPSCAATCSTATHEGERGHPAGVRRSSLEPIDGATARADHVGYWKPAGDERSVMYLDKPEGQMSKRRSSRCGDGFDPVVGDAACDSVHTLR